MNKEPRKENIISDLRKKAEERLQKQPGGVKAGTEGEVKQQLHELQVHQIELEMQNEELRRVQLELEASRTRYFDLYDMAPIGYLTVNAKGLILEANLTVAEMLGIDRGFLVNQPLSNFIVREDQDIYYLHRKALFESSKPQTFELKMQKSGIPFWVIIQSVVAHGDNNEPVSRITISNISVRKQAEEEIRLTDKRLESLLRLSNHKATSVHELLDFALSEAIALTSSKIGYIYRYDETSKEFTLNTWSREVMKECIIQEQQTVYMLDKTGIWGEAVRQAKPIIINDFHAPNPLKKGYPEGHSPIHKFLTVPIFMEGHIVGVVGVANKQTDYTLSDVNQLTLLMDPAWRIASQKYAEEAHKEVEKRFQLLFENMLDGFAHCKMVYDNKNVPVDFIYLEVNNSFERLTGLKNVVGKRVTEVIPEIGESNPELLKIYGRVASTGKTERFEINFKPLGLFLLVSVYSTAKGYFTAIFDDITYRKRAEESLKELNRSLEQRAADLFLANKDLEAFSYSVSHDLRNPLNAITTNIEVLSMELGSEIGKDTRSALDYIILGAGRMAQVISDLLTLSGISRKEIKSERVDLSLIVQNFLTELKTSNPNREVEVKVKPGLTVDGDPGLLRIFLENLIRNAWKFSSQRKRSIIEFGELDKEGQHCYFIRDNGAGFDMAEKGRLFKPFQRLHDLTEYKGSGIGLAIAKRIVEKHNGTIWAEGEKDKGATIFFCIGVAA